MKAIVTMVINGMPKNVPKEFGIDLFGRMSTDVFSRHKSFLMEEETLVDIMHKAMKTIENARISRIEIIED